MNIIYLTNAMRDNDFRLLVNLSKSKPNPSRQVFHDKMIRAIATVDNIQVYSLIPSSEHIIYEGHFESKSLIDFRYFETPKSRWSRRNQLPHEIAKTVVEDISRHNTHNNVIVYDALCLPMAKASLLIAKRTGLKRVAILTDNPKNMMGVSHHSQRAIIRYSRDVDGYIALSDAIVKVFNPDQPNVMITDTILEKMPATTPPYSHPFFYYGGALYAKSGLAALVGAYLLTTPDYDLLIAGHGPYAKELRILSKANPRIIFLGQVSKTVSYSYQRHASLNINPNPVNEALDKERLPSKVYEYIASGQPVLSTREKKTSESLSGRHQLDRWQRNP